MRVRLLMVLLAALLAAGLVTPSEGGPRPQQVFNLISAEAENDGRFYVVFRDFNPNAVAAVRAAGGRIALELPRHRAVAAYLPARAVSALARHPNVLRVEPDPRRYMLAQSTPYGISMVQADQLSDSDAAGRKVCVIDSGYYVNHEDLPSASVTGDSDPSAGPWYQDGFGHGTHVAGTIAALNNDRGVLGVLPNGTIRLHIIRVFGDSGAWAYSSTLVDALDRCRAAGANVVSMSLGGPNASFFEEAAFNEAYSAGVLSVAAAGNAGTTAFSYPASYESVISVAAIDSAKNVAGFSQKNSQVELSAPGVAVLSTVPYIETNTLTVGGVTYSGNWMQNAARNPGVTGALENGGRCTATNAAWSGKVVLCERGDIDFSVKVRNVQSSGGVAAAIYNNVAGNFRGTLGDGNSSTIPAISLSQADGQTLVATQLGAAATVVSTVVKPASSYEEWDGTSMATPHVSGVAALVWSLHPACSNAEIRAALRATAQDLGAAGRDTSYGFGLVQAKAASDYLTANPCTGGGGGGGGEVGTPVISGVGSRKLDKRGTFEIFWTTDIPATSHVLFTCCGLFSDNTLVTAHRMRFQGRKGTTYEYWVFSEGTPGGDNAAMAGPFYHRN